MRGSALVLAFALTTSVGALAQEKPKTYIWMLDAMLNARESPPKDSLVDGDFLSVTVDPTRVFGADPINVDAKKAASLMAPAAPDGGVQVSPEARYFYVAAKESTHYQMRPGACTPTDSTGGRAAADAGTDGGQAADAGMDGGQVTGGNEVLDCVQERFSPDGGWPVPNNFQVYRCPEATDMTLGKRLKQDVPNPWSLVIADPGEQPECVTSFQDVRPTLGSVKEVEVLYTRNGLPPERITAVVDQEGRWNANVTLREGTAELLVRVKFGNGQAQERTLPRFEVASRDTHSQVRVQAELLAGNRLRTVGLAVAVTPVTRRFFTEGPWSSRYCHIGCSTGPMVLLKIAGDNTSLVQFGVGWSVFLTQALHINGGLLFGTRDLGARWEPSRNWYLGIAIDPVLLAETRSVK